MRFSFGHAEHFNYLSNSIYFMLRASFKRWPLGLKLTPTNEEENFTLRVRQALEQFSSEKNLSERLKEIRRWFGFTRLCSVTGPGKLASSYPPIR